MPAGDLLSAPYQVEIRGALTGQGTDFLIEEGGIVGLGAPPPKTNDTDLGHDAGAYLGRDFTSVRILTIPYVISGEDADEAGALFFTLTELWEASETDIELHLQVPGFGHVTATGRPRGLADDLSLLHAGVARGLATFVCGNPTLTIESGSS